MNDSFRSQSGKPYSARDWLDNHHSIKSRLRSELILGLPINSGSRVLDIGCGTGVWTLLIAEMLGHSGTIIGVDVDKDAIELAERRRLSHYLGDRISFKCSDVTKYSPDEKFDYVILFNALSYLPNPSSFLKQILSLIHEGGTLIIKDSDLGSDFFWPVDMDLYYRLMLRITKFDETHGKNNYDPFFARKVPGILKEVGFSDIDVTSQSFSFSYPVDEKQRKYIAENGKMISESASLAGDKEGAKKWACQFEGQPSSAIFDDPKFLYSMTEFIFQARFPVNS